MNKQLELAKKGTVEIITIEELKEVLKKKNPVAYIGYEPSGKIHLGHLITIKKMIDLQKIGFKIKILLADYHAYLNYKGELDEIREIAEYNKRCFLAMGLSKDTEFILGSEFQTDDDYVLDLYRLAHITTLNRAKRSMSQIIREAGEHKVSEVLYPLMQVIDMVHLGVDVSVGGMEQRKIHMLARDNLPKIGYTPPVCIHTPIIHGTDGSEKMSSSKGNFIAVDDPPKVIKDKIMKSYCPAAKIDGNPVIEIAKYIIFDENKKF